MWLLIGMQLEMEIAMQCKSPEGVKNLVYLQKP